MWEVSRQAFKDVSLGACAWGPWRILRGLGLSHHAPTHLALSGRGAASRLGALWAYLGSRVDLWDLT